MEMKDPTIDDNEIEKIVKDTARKSKFSRFRRKNSQENKAKSHNKPKDNRKKKKKKSSRYKECPACGKEITRRTSEGTCIKCGAKIWLADGEYYLISKPQERLMIYNWSKFINKYTGVDVREIDNVKKLLPTPDEVSTIYLKNEAYASKKLLNLCNKDFELALSVLDIYHETTPRTNTGQLSLRYIISYPGLKGLLYKARKRRNELRLEELVSKDSQRSIEDRDEKLGRMHEVGINDMLSSEDE